ncbi:MULTISPECIES: hypothetical protein [Streptomyces]|uniref:Uncharacterized protein n=2 Tax=Streptomyces TaxID=1883 RepID=A0ABS9JLT2_9ACTN|nr:MULTISPECIES: hypothetical protein [Streptomyces]MCG0066519.1 hypothetical protein [Streptomyces tricolor]
MIRFLAGLAAAVVAGGITRLFTTSVPWLLLVGLAAAAVVWFGQYGVRAVADALEDVF